MNYKIISKFIKDISFEIPDAQTFVTLEKEISKYNLAFDIKSQPFKDNIIEVNTVLKLTPNQDLKRKMLAEINLTSLVSVEKNITDKKELEKIILVKIPTEVYSHLYEVFVYLFEQAGIKNISIDKEVNFEKMYSDKNKTYLKLFFDKLFFKYLVCVSYSSLLSSTIFLLILFLNLEFSKLKFILFAFSRFNLGSFWSTRFM